MDARMAQARAYLLRGGRFAGASAAGMPSEASCFDMARRRRSTGCGSRHTLAVSGATVSLLRPVFACNILLSLSSYILLSARQRVEKCCANQRGGLDLWSRNLALL
jgi:hypothetical protein